MEVFDQYRDVFNTKYNLAQEDIQLHINKLKELDHYLPPSSTYLMITNTKEGKYEFISKNFEYATGLSREQLLAGGIPTYLTLVHPDEIQIWLQVLNDLMSFCTLQYPPEKLNRLDFQYNYRFKIAEDQFLNILENQVNLLADDEGRPVVGLGHFTVFGNGEKLPIRATIRFLNERNEYETVFHKVYGTNHLLEDKISKRERDILRLIAMGFDNNTIAHKLYISSHTVRTHRKNLLGKTNSKNSTQLVVQCIREGLI